jgi:hypothetical protein
VEALTLDWQAWVWEAVEELLLFSRVFGTPPWDRLPEGIAACVGAVGGTQELARLANVQNMLLFATRIESVLLLVESLARQPGYEQRLSLLHCANLSCPSFLYSIRKQEEYQGETGLGSGEER